MAKVAIIVLADTETHGDMGRAANALKAVGEFKEADGEVQLIFDGAGTKWIAELSKADHRLNSLFDSLKDVAGACSHCVEAFGVKEDAQSAEVPLLAGYDGHPSLKKLIAQGYQVITF